MALKFRSKTITVLAALGLRSLVFALGAVTSAALWASPARAQTQLPGVGTVIKQRPGNARIIVAADVNGETRITGLETALYTVRVFNGTEEVPMKVGRDGRLAFKTWEDQVSPKGIRSRVSIASSMRRWAEQIAFDPAPNDYSLLAKGRPGRTIIDVNKADGAQLIDSADATRESVAAIVSERTRNGPFIDLVDFARRICPQTAVDFRDASIHFGSDTILVQQEGEPKQSGFKCARGTGEMKLFSVAYAYVGHVTLLR